MHLFLLIFMLQLSNVHTIYQTSYQCNTLEQIMVENCCVGSSIMSEKWKNRQNWSRNAYFLTTLDDILRTQHAMITTFGETCRLTLMC